jgi:hypothetical protein
LASSLRRHLRGFRPRRPPGSAPEACGELDGVLPSSARLTPVQENSKALDEDDYGHLGQHILRLRDAAVVKGRLSPVYASIIYLVAAVGVASQAIPAVRKGLLAFAYQVGRLAASGKLTFFPHRLATRTGSS